MPGSDASKLKTFVDKGSFYSAVVEDGSDIILVVDFQGTILYHNTSALHLLGYSSKALKGKNLLSFIHPDDKAIFKRRFTESQKMAYNQKVEFRILRKDKSYRFLEFNSINLKHKENIKGLILDCRDITQRKKDAEEMLRLQKIKEQFLANISHEIRTPINGIAGMASLLSLDQSSDDRQTYLNAIKHSAENLKVIINDILDIASIESGKFKFEKVHFNLADLLPSTISMFRYQARDKKIALECSLDENANRMLIGDPVRLNQILINLIGNAVKFTHQGSILVNGSIAKEETNRCWVEISVKDTGVGIPKEKVATIFDSFSQADASITRKYGGTGLGLSIVKQLVELQQGTITVKSKENVGSVFTITIPYEKGKTKKSSRSTQQLSELPITIAKPISVLLVEDNDINRLYAQSILRNWNCTTDVAENGVVAIERIKNNTYDIVLMDIQMPVMDGYETTKAIRMMGGASNSVPIIALTANATKRDIDKCLAAGMNDYLAKPFTPDDLYKKIFKEVQQQFIRQLSFDLTYLKEVSNNDSVFIKEMIQTFVDTAPALLQKISHASKKSDWVTVARVVHQMKPSLTLLGIHQLKDSAIKIERSLKALTDEKKSAPKRSTILLIHAFVSTVKTSVEELQTHLRTLSAGS